MKNLTESLLEYIKETQPEVVKGWDGHSIRVEATQTRKGSGYERELNVDLSNKPERGGFSVPVAVIEIVVETSEVKVKYCKGAK